ncbi:hypothetical protein D3C86_2189280 [compost metagenome]
MPMIAQQLDHRHHSLLFIPAGHAQVKFTALAINAPAESAAYAATVRRRPTATGHRQ